MDKWLLGFLVGALLGGSLFYLAKAGGKQKKQLLQKIEAILAELGEMTEEPDARSKQKAIEQMFKQLLAKDAAAKWLAIAATGLKLWKKWR
jgi:hypothetical protein